MKIFQYILGALFFILKVTACALMFIILYIVATVRVDDYDFVDARTMIEKEFNIDDIIRPQSEGGYIRPSSPIRRISDKYVIYPVLVSKGRSLQDLHILVFSSSLELEAEVKYESGAYQANGDDISFAVYERNGIVYYPENAFEFKSYKGIKGDEIKSVVAKKNKNINIIINESGNAIASEKLQDFYKAKDKLSHYNGLYDAVIREYKRENNSSLIYTVFSTNDPCKEHLFSSLISCSKYAYEFNHADNALHVSIKKLSSENEFIFDYEKSFVILLIKSIAIIPINIFGTDVIGSLRNEFIEVRNVDVDGEFLIINASDNGFMSDIHKNFNADISGDMFLHKKTISGFKDEVRLIDTPIYLSKCVYITAISDDRPSQGVGRHFLGVGKIVRLNMCAI